MPTIKHLNPSKSHRYQIGKMYEVGRGVRKDFSKARQWYQRAADKGHAKAQFNMGYMCIRNNGQDCGMAAEWFKKAAQQGHKEAQSGAPVSSDS